jgi:tetratricopeptide (TPR) repeat protein
MAETPKRRQSFIRLERVLPLIEKKMSALEDARRVLEVLVMEAEKGRPRPELWQGLHDAAIRDDLLVELSFAYEQLAGGKRFNLLPAAVQGQVLAHAATFFHDVLEDVDKGIEWYGRVLGVTPDHAAAFSIVERHFKASRNHLGLADLYATVAAGRGAADRQAPLLARRAVEMLERLPGADERAIQLCKGLLAVDPGHRPLWRLLESRCRKLARLRDAADFLEREIGEQPPADAAELLGLRLRLIALCMASLKDYEGALAQVEAILAADPGHDEARKVAERLVGQPSVAGRAAAILNERRRRLALRGV